MNEKKLGIIQTGGLGDIHIALPIAFYYHEKGFEIYWPIFDHWVEQMTHYAPWINWMSVERDKGLEHAYEIPKKKKKKKSVDKILPLYNFLSSKPELSKVPYFPHVTFDQFKYFKADVPFFYKWKLNQCIKRDDKREKETFDKYVKNKNYVVTHLKASVHNADFDKSIIPNNHQVIEISNDGYVLDWLKIIENAKILFMTNSVMANITDQLNIEVKKFFIPRTNIFLSPTFLNNWTWLKNKNIDPKTNLTGIKF